MMKTLFGIAAIALMAAPVQATNLDQAMGNFCTAIKEANDMGVSGAPGTPMAKYAAKASNQSDSAYQMVWTMAKTSRCSYIF